VIGFYDSWTAGRRYAVDMAGFAVNVKLLHRYPNATIIYKAGYEEDQFLQVLLADSSSLIEPKAANCTQVFIRLIRCNVPEFLCSILCCCCTDFSLAHPNGPSPNSVTASAE